MSIIRSETATVYHGGGRRWFTVKAACNAAARAKIKTRCECEKGDYETPGITCSYHDDVERYSKIKRRLARIYQAEMLDPPLDSTDAGAKTA